MGRIYSERSRDRAERPGVRVKRKKPSVGLIPNQPPDSQPASWESGCDDHDTSGAAKKLKSSDFAAQVDASFGYRILNFPTVFSAISESVKCKACNGEVDFTEINIAGLEFQLVISCNKCEPRKVAACPKIGQAYDLNHRIVSAFRSLGIDLSGIEKFCAIMDLPKPTFEHSYDTIVEDIQQATEVVGGFTMKNIAEEEDASNGVNGSPASRCHANHAGSAGKGEVSGTAEIFPKSEESLGVECTNYIGDGDSETSRGLEFDSGSSTCGSLRSSGAASSSLNGTSKRRSPACKVMEDAPSAFGISATGSPSSTSSIGETSPRPDELHDRLGLPDDCQLEFVNGGHGIKNPFAVQYRRNPTLSRNEPWPPQPPPVKDNDPNPYTCRVCSKSFSGIVRLNRHMKRHSDIKRFLCTHCGNGFYDAYDLKRHTRTHTGVRPYKCNLCDKSFTQRGTLEAHCRKLHSVKHQYGHNEKRPKVYVCEECAHTTEDADVHDLHVKDKHPKYW